MIQCYDFKGTKVSVFGSLVNINRATCTGLGCELAWAATQARDGLWPTFPHFPLFLRTTAAFLCVFKERPVP